MYAKYCAGFAFYVYFMHFDEVLYRNRVIEVYSISELLTAAFRAECDCVLKGSTLPRPVLRHSGRLDSFIANKQHLHLDLWHTPM